MEVEVVNKAEGPAALPRSTPSVVAIAISGSKKSKYLLKWALKNFLPQENVCFKLLHVYPHIPTVPTPLGTSIPISQVRDDVATAYKKEVEWQTNEKILPFKLLLNRRKLQVDLVQIEADDVANAIAKEVAKCNIKKLVVGVSFMGIFSRGHNWSAKISECVSSFCTIYVVSKGKLSSVRPAHSGTNGNLGDDKSNSSSFINSPGIGTSLQIVRTGEGSSSSSSFQSPPLPRNHFLVHSTINQTVQSLIGKRKSQRETIQPNSSDHETREGGDGLRSFISSLGIKDTDRPTSHSYVPSSPRPMPQPEAVSNENWNPVPKSGSLSRKIYPRHMSPTGGGEEDGSYKPRSTHFNASYNQGLNSHIQSSSSQSQQFQALSAKRKLSSHKGGKEDFSTDYFCRSALDSTNREASYSQISLSPPVQSLQALSLNDQTLLHQSANISGSINPRHMPRDTGNTEDEVSTICSGSNNINSQDSSFRSLGTENYSISWTTEQASTTGAPTDFSSGSQVNISFELEKLRMELRHMQGLYSIAQSVAINASWKLNDLQKCRQECTINLKEIQVKEKEANERAEQGGRKCEAAKRVADYAKQCDEKEEAQRNQEEIKDSCKAKEKEELKNALVHQCQIFSWEEIMYATESFSDSHRVGMGSYGTVYKCSLRHTTVAVKVLHSTAAHRTKQFQQELQILSKIRHPHLLTLLGACPERGCLIYEYMENGSLEERLFRKPNRLPLPWFERYRIAQEVASALMFLHSSKPKPIVHQDLKPATILLDHNLVSKIGDVGLSTMVQPDSAALHTIYKDTNPVGTFCYIDPEYQRTGTVSPQSDVYALGIVILQLLTAKPAIALAHTVEEAVADNKLTEVLDPEAGEWPFGETKELALLALKCTEICRRDRPDLKDQILPTLEKLRMVGDKLHLASHVPTRLLSHFICPLLKDVMNDPCVAADGYTYDRKAIEAWLEENDNSPVTNEALPHKHLLPNYNFLSAIMEWKSGKTLT